MTDFLEKETLNHEHMSLGRHVHVLEDGTTVEHSHEHSADHDHKHNHDHMHNHDHAHPHDHSHGHTHGHGHGHTHSPESTKAVLNRLSRAIGHLESIRRMVESGRDCSEVLVQLSAVKSAINNTGKVILHEHITHCIVDAVECGDSSALDELNKAIDQFIK